ncbi:hypothetical protein [uncultured Ottowia sp.]|uniref:hypothetical protein n=1 Tax=uncultured Ottowia sp. TaxID=543067 RepID=UPI0025950D90|nr:hypothetical protein [uncultured Ottowia sp.]
MKNDNLDHENRPVKYGITPDDLQQMQQRRIEAHAARETSDALNLLRAVKLGAALCESQD